MNEIKAPKTLITTEEFNAFLEKWPETIASLTEAWTAVWDVVMDTVSVLHAWLEESGIGVCSCHAESLTYKGECLRCVEED